MHQACRRRPARLPLVAILLASLWAAWAPLHAAEPPTPPEVREPIPDPGCSARTLASFPVRAVTDSENVLLDDGREYNIGILTAGLDDEAARSALNDLVSGRSISIFPPQEGQPISLDRYGRLRGDAMVPAATGTEKISLQGALIARGLARVTFARPLPCSQQELLRAEGEARRSKAGHWATGVFSVLDANASAAVAAHIGQFAVIEGRLRRASKSRKGIYLNFGSKWREDFTVFIPARLTKPPRTTPRPRGHTDERTELPSQSKPVDTIASLGLNLKGHPTLRTRGWVEQRGGPLIEIQHLDQIELVKQ